MYSVVLMMAMTGGAEAPAGFFGHDCYGSCYGSCHGYSCHGWGHGHSCHGWSCNGYSCTGWSCSGWGYSCHGCHGWGHHHSCYGCNGCYGGNYASCYGGCYGSCYGSCHGGWFHRHHHHECCETCAPVTCGCCGAPAGPAAPAAPAPMPAEKKVSEEISTSAPATLVVNLPADAKLLIDDAATTSTSTRRIFVSPKLPVGQEFTYSLKAEFTKNGKPVVVSKEVSVRAGAEVNVTIEAAIAGVVSR